MAMSAAFPRSSAAGSNAASRRSAFVRSIGLIGASSSFSRWLEQFAQVCARAIEPRAHGADRQLERLGNVLVRELFPREEQERLALLVRERVDRIGDA